MTGGRRGRLGAWLFGVIGAALVPHGVRADVQVGLIGAPAGESAERIAARVSELLEAASATTSTRFAADPADASALAPADGELALVAIDVSSSERVVVRVRAVNGDTLERTLLLSEHAVDETACEEVATVVASSVEALISSQPADAGVTQAAPTSTPAAVPEGKPSDAPVTDSVGPAVDRAAEVEREPRARGATLPAQGHALVGYETALWNGSHILHGPRWALGYGVPLQSITGWLGARAEAFHALSTRAESERLDVEVAATALRLLATFDRALGQRFGLELGAGVSAELAQLRAVSAPEDTHALRARAQLSWAARACAGARYSHGAMLVAAGVSFEFHPLKVEYGVQHSDGFVSTHAAARVRPGALVSAGLQW